MDLLTYLRIIQFTETLLVTNNKQTILFINHFKSKSMFNKGVCFIYV